MLNSLKIGPRLGLLIAPLLALLALISYLAVINLGNARNDLQVSAEQKLKPTRLAGRLQS